MRKLKKVVQEVELPFVECDACKREATELQAVLVQFWGVAGSPKFDLCRSCAEGLVKEWRK